MLVERGKGERVGGHSDLTWPKKAMLLMLTII